MLNNIWVKIVAIVLAIIVGLLGIFSIINSFLKVIRTLPPSSYTGFILVGSVLSITSVFLFRKLKDEFNRLTRNSFGAKIFINYLVGLMILIFFGGIALGIWAGVWFIGRF